MLERITKANQTLGLTEKWINDISPALKTREAFLIDLENNTFKIEGSEAVFRNGLAVPSFLVQPMALWAKQGPTILCSYCHPEEFDLYKFTAHFNLVKLVDGLKNKGFEIPKEKVMENWYETVALNESVLQPLNFGGILPKDKLKVDPLGIAGHKFGSAVLDLNKHQERLQNTREQIPFISESIINRFTLELDDALKEKRPDLTRRQRNDARQEGIRDLLISRISRIVNFADFSSVGLFSKATPTVNDLLFDVQQKFGGFIFDDRKGQIYSSKMSEITGIKGKLSLSNKAYECLVMDTLGLLIESKGARILRGLVSNTGEGLFLGFIENGNFMLTVDKEDKDGFVLVEAKTGAPAQKIPDMDVLHFIRKNNFMPLAKAESLALISGGVSLHMGSEHGNRERVLSALGLDDVRFRPFRDYLSNLHIGADLEQGSEPFYLAGTKAMPAVLAYILFGEDALCQMLTERIGNDTQPAILTEKEIKKLVAEKLVESFSSL